MGEWMGRGRVNQGMEVYVVHEKTRKEGRRKEEISPLDYAQLLQINKIYVIYKLYKIMYIFYESPL